MFTSATSGGTYNFATAASTSTKTLNIGTGAVSPASTIINIGTNNTTSSNIFLQGEVSVGKSRVSAGASGGYSASISGPSTTVTGSTGNATGGNLSILSGGAGISDVNNTSGIATSGNISIDSATSSHAWFDGTTLPGNVSIGTLAAGAVGIGRSGITTTISGAVALPGTVGGYTMTGSLVGATTGTSLAPIRLPTGTVPTTANQQFGMIAADAESLQLATTKTTGAGPGFGFIRAPQMVYAVANSGAATTTTAVSPFAASSDVLSSLEPAKSYRFRGTYYFTSTFTSGTPTIQLAFAFSNAPVIFKYNYKTYRAAGQAAFDFAGQPSTNAATTVSASVTSSISYVVEFEGFFTSHATLASTLTPQFRMSATGVSTVATAGSFFEVQKLGTSTQTTIAGNWA
jgi:hypothetical protein